MAETNIVVELPIGPLGLYGSKNTSRIPIESLIQAENLTYENETIQKEGGATKYNSSAVSGSTIGGHDWNHDGGTQRMVIMTSDGALLKDTGAGTFGTTLASGLTTTDILPIFAEGGKEAAANNRKLFIFTEKNAVQVLSADGASTSNLSSPPADWSGADQPRFGMVHEGRLWGGGNANDPHRMYYSTTDDHENFLTGDAGTVSVYPGEGEHLIGGVSYRGALVLFKYPAGIYLIDTTDSTISNWKVRRISGSLGCAGVRAYTQVENEIIYIDQSGIPRNVIATDEFNDIGSHSLVDTKKMDVFFREILNRNQSNKWVLTYYPTKREVHMGVTSVGETTNNGRFVIDLNQPNNHRFRWSPRDTAVSLWTRDNNSIPELVYGNDSGFIYKLDQEAREKDSAGYRGLFQIPHLDFSHIDQSLATRRKQGQFLEIAVEPKGNWNLSVDIYWDNSLTETVQFNMGTTGAALGSFVLGTDKLSGDQLLTKRQRITGGGRRFSIVGRNSGLGQDFSIAKMYLHMTLGDQRF